MNTETAHGINNDSFHVQLVIVLEIVLLRLAVSDTSEDWPKQQ